MTGKATVAGRYEIRAPLGSGGMATVWQAVDSSTGRAVAVKRLHPHLALDESAAARFKQEARAAASLSHRSATRVLEAGDDQEGPYLVMELVEGRSLADLLEEQGRLTPQQAVDVAGQIAEALHHAHRRGVVHRDVKPSNILLEPGGGVKVADFGIARTLDDTTALTTEGTVIGTPSYMAPEVGMGSAATPASDVYSLGVLLYEMLTGRLPFGAGSPISVMVAHQLQHPEPPSTYVDLPPSLETTVLRALEKEPRHRFASAAEMAAALGAWQDGGSGWDGAGSRPTVPLDRLPRRPTRRLSGAGPARRPRRLMLTLALLLAGALALAAAGRLGAALVMLPEPAPRSERASATTRPQHEAAPTTAPGAAAPPATEATTTTTEAATTTAPTTTTTTEPTTTTTAPTTTTTTEPTTTTAAPDESSDG